MVDLVCNTCGLNEVFLQVRVQGGLSALLFCGNCGEAEIVLWNQGQLYFGPWSRFSRTSTVSTGPTTTTIDI